MNTALIILLVAASPGMVGPGIGKLLPSGLIFDADGSSQQGNGRVPAGPIFGGPEWTGLFVHACREAKRLDLELSLNIQSGWNLGGPKVTAEEATQTLVWSKTRFEGPATTKQILPLPKHRDLYRDIAVIAVPVPETGSDKQAAADVMACVIREFTLKDGETLKARFDPQRATSIRLLFTSSYDANPVKDLVFNHTFTCSPQEMGLPGQEYFAGTHFNPQVTWWDEAPAFIDYLRRCQFLAQQGHFTADVVYYYGDHIPNIATLKESDPGSQHLQVCRRPHPGAAGVRRLRQPLRGIPEIGGK